MQTLFKSNLFSNSSSKVGAKKFLSGGKKLGSSIVGAAKNNIINFSRTAKAMVPQKKEENENSFIKNYTNFFGSKKTEKILRKNLKLVRDSLVNTFEIARHLKAAIVSISKGLKGGVGKGGGLFDALKSFLAGALGGALIAALPILLKLVALGGLIAFGVALWQNEKFRKATMNFIGSVAKDIVNLLWSGIKALLPKWIWNPVGFIRDIITGGDEFSKKHSELDQRLKDAGMNTKGKSLDRSRQDNRHGTSGRSPEQEKIFKEVEEERAGLKSQKKEMKGDIKSTLSDITSDRKPKEDQLKKEIRSLPFGSKKRNAKEKELRIHQTRTRKLKKEAKENIISDANQKVSSVGTETEKKDEVTSDKIEGEKTSVKSVEKKDEVTSDNTLQDQNVEGVKSDLNNLSFAESLKMAESGKNFLTFEPITFGNASDEQSTSGGDVTSTSSGGTTGGDAVTFYASSNPDSSYHKLNAMVTFNIV